MHGKRGRRVARWDCSSRALVNCLPCLANDRRDCGVGFLRGHSAALVSAFSYFSSAADGSLCNIMMAKGNTSQQLPSS